MEVVDGAMAEALRGRLRSYSRGSSGRSATPQQQAFNNGARASPVPMISRHYGSTVHGGVKNPTVVVADTAVIDLTQYHAPGERRGREERSPKYGSPKRALTRGHGANEAREIAPSSTTRVWDEPGVRGGGEQDRRASDSIPNSKYKQAVERLEAVRRRAAERDGSAAKSKAPAPAPAPPSPEVIDTEILTSKHERLVQQSLEYRKKSAVKEVIHLEDEDAKVDPNQGPSWSRLFLDTTAMRKGDDTRALTKNDDAKDYVSAFSYEFKKKRGDPDEQSDIIVIDDILEEFYESKPEVASRRSRNPTNGMNSLSAVAHSVAARYKGRNDPPVEKRGADKIQSIRKVKTDDRTPDKPNSLTTTPAANRDADKKAKSDDKSPDKSHSPTTTPAGQHVSRSLQKGGSAIASGLDRGSRIAIPNTPDGGATKNDEKRVSKADHSAGLAIERTKQSPKSSTNDIPSGPHGSTPPEHSAEPKVEVSQTSSPNPYLTPPDEQNEEKAKSLAEVRAKMLLTLRRRSASLEKILQDKSPLSLETANEPTLQSEDPKAAMSLSARSATKVSKRRRAASNIPSQLASPSQKPSVRRRAVSSSPARRRGIADNLSVSTAKADGDNDALAKINQMKKEESKKMSTGDDADTKPDKVEQMRSPQAIRKLQATSSPVVERIESQGSKMDVDSKPFQAVVQDCMTQTTELGGKQLLKNEDKEGIEIEQSAANYVKNLALGEAVSSESGFSGEMRDDVDTRETCPTIDLGKENAASKSIVETRNSNVETKPSADPYDSTGFVDHSVSESNSKRSDDSTSGEDNSSFVSTVDSSTVDSELESLEQEQEKYDSCSIPFAMHILENTCAWMERRDSSYCGQPASLFRRVEYRKDTVPSSNGKSNQRPTIANCFGGPPPRRGTGKRYDRVEKYNRSTSLMDGVSRHGPPDQSYLRDRDDGPKPSQVLQQRSQTPQPRETIKSGTHQQRSRKKKSVGFDTSADAQSVLTPKYSNTSKSKSKTAIKKPALKKSGPTEDVKRSQKQEVKKSRQAVEKQGQANCARSIPKVKSVDESRSRYAIRYEDAVRAAHSASPTTRWKSYQPSHDSSKDNSRGQSPSENEPPGRGSSPVDPIVVDTLAKQDPPADSPVNRDSIEVESSFSVKQSNSFASGPETVTRRRPQPEDNAKTVAVLSEEQRLAALSLAERLRNRASMLKRHRKLRGMG